MVIAWSRKAVLYPRRLGRWLLSSPAVRSARRLVNPRNRASDEVHSSSQGDGTAQFVARSSDDRLAAMQKITSACPNMQCFPLTLHPRSSDSD